MCFDMKITKSNKKFLQYCFILSNLGTQILGAQIKDQPQNKFNVVTQTLLYKYYFTYKKTKGKFLKI